MTKSGGVTFSELPGWAQGLTILAVLLIILFIFLGPWMSAMIQSNGKILSHWFTTRGRTTNWGWIDSTKDDNAFLDAQAEWIKLDAAATPANARYPVGFTQRVKSAFAADPALSKSVAPGLSQRFDIGRSDTGDFGTTLNARSAAASAQPAAFRSGLTGGREAPYFPEGSIYNIEGKVRDGVLATGAEGFRRSRFAEGEFKPEDNPALYG